MTGDRATAGRQVTRQDPGQRAVAVKGWWRSHRMLVLRRMAQAIALAMFASGPLLGVWVMRGTLASSELLGSVPFTDPLVLMQALAAGHGVTLTAWVGAALLLGLYAVIGGRVFCSWLCPINPLTDLAHWLRVRYGAGNGLALPRSARLWMIAVVILTSVVTGGLAWETVNPVTLLHRDLVYGLLFGGSLGGLVILAVVLLDVVGGNRLWCGHLCPVGAVWGIIGQVSLLRVSAPARAACDSCMACYHVCPEPHVLTPALKGHLTPALKGQGKQGPLILSGDCTNCGRCLDICHAEVFAYTHRFDQTERTPPSRPREGRTDGTVLREGESLPC